MGMPRNSKKTSSRRKTRKSEISSIVLDNIDTIFPILLAALTNHGNRPKSQNMVKKCLTKLHSSFSKSLNPFISSDGTLPVSVLSLLPLLLSHRCPEIARRSAEIVGAASLYSFQMNEQIASDDEIVKVLILVVGSSRRKVSMAACNAILDLSSTSIGRRRLLDFSALDRLMILILQVPISSTAISLCAEDYRNANCIRIALKEDGLKISLLQAAIFLINTCNIELLEKIPRKLSESFLVVLRKLWAKVRSQMLLGNPMVSIPDKHLCFSNITVNNIAESIFRLSASTDQFAHLQSVLVKRRIFGWSEHSFKTFMLQHWEASPVLVRRPLKSLTEVDEIFSPFTESLNYKESPYAFFSHMLQSFVSCLPIASDELDILNFLEEGRNELGCPIIYQQDIRVLRTEKQSQREVHFFHESLNPSFNRTPHIFSLADIMKCEEACKEGYTIALRGMEFRFASIAAITDTLASLFGQPSVGANLYLTPPNSQGLACHCDDHCVFVCQLYGNKQWKICSEPNMLLPRLYDQLDNQHFSDAKCSLADCRKFFLREGDVLYLPRGFAHEACTENTDSCDLGRFSLHVTFGIEVEPPFEWAGFAHVALHHWNQTQKQPDHAWPEPMSGILNVVTKYLLHAMIDLIGASDPTFRKACLVGALSLPLDRQDWLYFEQKTIFHYLINKISTESRFLEVLRIVEVAIQKKEDPLQRIKWLQLLNKEREIIQRKDWATLFMRIENLLPVYVQHQDCAEAAFVKIKTKFCDDVSFEDVIDSYKILYEKYKKARNHYLNGMLSLHCN